MPNTPPSYLSTAFPGVDDAAIATLGNTPGVSLNGTVPYTVQFFVNFDALGCHGVVLGQAGVFSVVNVFDTVVVRMEGWQPVATDPSMATLAAGRWLFVAVTFDGASLDIFIDGVPAASAQPARTGSFAWSRAPLLCGHGLKGRVRGIQLFAQAKLQSELDPSNFDDAGTLPEGLVQYFDFGTATPATLSGRPISLGGGVAVVGSVASLRTAGTGWVQPVLDGGVNPAGSPGAPYTVQAWVRVSAPTGTLTVMAEEEADIPVQVIFANNDVAANGGGMSLQVAYNATNPQAVDLIGVHGSGSGASTVTAAAALLVEQWANVALVCDGSTLTLYVDGIAQGEPETIRQGIPPLAAGSPSIAGVPASGAFGAQTLQGRLYGLSVWSTALQPADVQANLTTAPVPGSNGLAGYYDLALPPGSNSATGAPLALIGAAAFVDTPDPAVSIAAEPVNLRVKPPAPGPNEALLARLRASVDKPAAAAGVIGHLEQVRTAMPTLVTRLGLRSQAVQRQASAEIDALIATARRDPFELPTGILVRHEDNGEVIIVQHFSKESVILARYAVGTSNCAVLLTVLIVSFVFLLVNVLFGLGSLFGRVLPRVQAAIAGRPPADLNLLEKALVALAPGANTPLASTVLTWFGAVRSLFYLGIMPTVFELLLSEASLFVALAIALRFAAFATSWPVQLSLFVVRLIANGANLYFALTTYLSECQKGTANTALLPDGGTYPA